MKSIIEWNKHIFRATGDLLSPEAIQQTKWASIYQLVSNPADWGSPHLLSFEDDKDCAILIYVEIHDTSKRSRETHLWYDQLQKAMRENTVFPRGLPNDIIFSHTMILLSAQQRTWFLEQMTKIDSLPLQDCGEPEEVAQGNPYVSYGQYYSPQTGFRAFFDWASKGQSNCRQFEHIFYQLVASIFPLNATFQRLLQE